MILLIPVFCYISPDVGKPLYKIIKFITFYQMEENFTNVIYFRAGVGIGKELNDVTLSSSYHFRHS